VTLIPESVRSSSSCRLACTQRSMTGFILGIWTRLSMTWIPASFEDRVEQACGCQYSFTAADQQRTELADVAMSHRAFITEA
jgi:hypothetical protein